MAGELQQQCAVRVVEVQVGDPERPHERLRRRRVEVAGVECRRRPPSSAVRSLAADESRRLRPAGGAPGAPHVVDDHLARGRARCSTTRPSSVVPSISGATGRCSTGSTVSGAVAGHETGRARRGGTAAASTQREQGEPDASSAARPAPGASGRLSRGPWIRASGSGSGTRAELLDLGRHQVGAGLGVVDPDQPGAVVGEGRDAGQPGLPPARVVDERTALAPTTGPSRSAARGRRSAPRRRPRGEAASARAARIRATTEV